MKKAIKLSSLINHPYRNIGSPRNRARYNFIMGSRGSLKSTFVASHAIINMNVNDTTTSVLYIIKQKNKHASTTYKSIKNAMRKLGCEHDWVMSGSEKSTPYVYRDNPKTGRRQEILFRGVSNQDDIDKILSLEGDRVSSTGEVQGIDLESTRWLIIIDEFQTIRSNVAETIFSKLDESIRGTTKNLPHQFFFVGNPPKSKNHFFNKLFNLIFGTNKSILQETMEKELYQELIVKDFLGSNAHFLRTCYLTTPKEWLGEPFFNKMEYYKKRVPKKYLTESLGIFIEGSGEVYDQFSQDKNVFSFDRWVECMNGLERAKHTTRNLMKSGFTLYFENASSTFVDELRDIAKRMKMNWIRVDEPYKANGKIGKEEVKVRTNGVNAGFEGKTLLISDKCSKLIEEIESSVFDEKKKENGLLIRAKQNDHGLDGLDYGLSGKWAQWKRSKLWFDPNKMQRTIKFVGGGDFGDGGVRMEGEGATTCYIIGYSAGYRRAFVLDEFYWKNKLLEEHKRIGAKMIALKLINFLNKFAEGKW